MKELVFQVGSRKSPANNFWSATENSSTNAWNVNLNNGNTNNNNKNNTNQLRCVRKRRPAHLWPKTKNCHAEYTVTADRHCEELEATKQSYEQLWGHILHLKIYIAPIWIAGKEKGNLCIV